MDREAVMGLVEAAVDASGLLKAIVTTHADHMSADQRQVINDTVENLRAAAAKLED